MQLLHIIFFILITATSARHASNGASNASPIFSVKPSRYSVDATSIKVMEIFEEIEEEEEEPVITSDTITLHFSKSLTEAPLNLPLNATATKIGAQQLWALSETVDITTLGTLAVNDIIYVYVSFEADPGTNTRIALPEPAKIRILPPYTFDPSYIEWDLPEEFTNVIISVTTTDKATPTMKMIFATEPTLAGGTPTIEFDNIQLEEGYDEISVPVTFEDLVDQLAVKLYSTIYVFLQDASDESPLIPEPFTMFVHTEPQFKVDQRTLIVGTKKVEKFSIRRESIEDSTANQQVDWEDTIKVKLSLNRPTPANGDVTFNAKKNAEDGKWYAKNVDITGLGTLVHEGMIYAHVSPDASDTYLDGFATIYTIDYPGYTFFIDPTSITFAQLPNTPKIIAHSEQTELGTVVFRTAFTNAKGVMMELFPQHKWDSDLERTVLPPADLTPLGITPTDLPAAIAIDLSMTEGASWDFPTVTLTVNPDFTIDPTRILPAQIANTPEITIGGEKASWGDTLKAKFTSGDKFVDAPVTATGDRPSRSITIAAGQDLTALGLTKFPAVIDVHLSINGGSTFIDSTARLTVGEEEDRALGVIPRLEMLIFLIFLCCALL